MSYDIRGARLVLVPVVIPLVTCVKVAPTWLLTIEELINRLERQTKVMVRWYPPLASMVSSLRPPTWQVLCTRCPMWPCPIVCPKWCPEISIRTEMGVLSLLIGRHIICKGKIENECELFVNTPLTIPPPLNCLDPCKAPGTGRRATSHERRATSHERQATG